MPSNRRGRRTNNNNNNRNNNHGNFTPGQQVPRGSSAFQQRNNANNAREVEFQQDALLRMSLPEVQAYLRSQLSSHGTNVTMNDEDPYGDGDQSPVASHHAQFYRDMYASGGDINHHADIELRMISNFAKLCLMGDVDRVEQALQAASVGYKEGPPPAALTELLEKRETSQRLSPLLMLVSIGKNLQVASVSVRLAAVQVEVAKVLLRYGARPDARDFAGKTVCHYGMGMMATMHMTVEIACACSEAHKSSDLYGRQVELHGLEGASELNGSVGWCRGYQVDKGRRIVYLPNEGRLVNVKRKNIKLVVDIETTAASVETEGTEGDGSEKPAFPGWLCDIPDRLGSVCLHELVQSEREDIARLLFDKYVADINVADVDGVSPSQMSTRGGAALVNRVAAMITAEAGFRASKVEKILLRQCTNCGAKSSTLKDCQVCRSVQYCNRECQMKHWKQGGHKEVCKTLAAKRSQAIQLDKPGPSQQSSSTFSYATRMVTPAEPEGSGYRKPSNVALDEHFDIKVQGGSPAMPLMIYDKSRECNFTLHPGERGFDELRQAVNNEPTWNGRKTFVLAQFDADGNCMVFPGCTSVKKW